MPILRRTQNYRAIQLHEHTTGENIGVHRRDGSLGYVTWPSSVGVVAARRIRQAVPVKLAIVAYTLDDDPTVEWVAVPPCCFVQECVTVDSARCVREAGRPRIVQAHTPAASSSERLPRLVHRIALSISWVRRPPGGSGLRRRHSAPRQRCLDQYGFSRPGSA